MLLLRCYSNNIGDTDPSSIDPYPRLYLSEDDRRRPIGEIVQPLDVPLLHLDGDQAGEREVGDQPTPVDLVLEYRQGGAVVGLLEGGRSVLQLAETDEPLAAAFQHRVAHDDDLVRYHRQIG